MEMDSAKPVPTPMVVSETRGEEDEKELGAWVMNMKRDLTEQQQAEVKKALKI